MSPYAFISYRREDADAHARSLRDDLNEAFGPNAVFMDTRSIGPGDAWAQELQSSVRGAAVVIAVIGRYWLKSQDEYGRRRIDSPEDWVQRELTTALDNNVKIIPVLVGRATLPLPQALPPAILRLLDFNAIELREQSWAHDVAQLILALETTGFSRRTVPYRFPTKAKRASYPPPLSDEELTPELHRIPGWSKVVSPLPGQEPLTRDELIRTYRFKSFEDAMRFMWLASAEASRLQHHPRWENLWKMVTVALSTWDMKHVITKLDLELAEAFDRVANDVTSGTEHR